ncbi:MAG: response regulator transcription factor [Verrucomicrobia bacterium]|nr:response regulator transcription factor [Verrucomicrobiota bacterium]
MNSSHSTGRIPSGFEEIVSLEPLSSDAPETTDVTPLESAPSRKAQILVVDDHSVLRNTLIRLINEQNDLICCGQADTSLAALAAMDRGKPDLVLLDLRLGAGDGLDLIEALKAQHPDLFIIVFTQRDEKLYAERAFRAGARGYVVKSQGIKEVLAAIRAVLRGNIYVGKEVALEVFQTFLVPRRSSTAEIARLTNRELEIFRLLGEGLSTREIGTRIRLSSKTVDTHRENIKRKLLLINARDVMRRAIEWVHGSAPS